MKKTLILVLEIAVAVVLAIAGLALLPRADGTCLLAAGLLLGIGAVMHRAKPGTMNPWVTRGTAAVLLVVALLMPSGTGEETQTASDLRMAVMDEAPATTIPTTAPTTVPTTTTTTTTRTTTTTPKATTTTKTTKAATTTPKATTTTTKATTTTRATTTTTKATTTTAPVIVWTAPATTAATVPPVTERSAPAEEEKTVYVLNTNTMKVHNVWCTSVNDIYDNHRVDTTKSIEEILAMGYVKCKKKGDWDRVP